MQPGLNLLIIQEQSQDVGAQWMTVQSPSSYVPTWDCGVRLALRKALADDYVEGEDAWTVVSADVIGQGTLWVNYLNRYDWPIMLLLERRRTSVGKCW